MVWAAVSICCHALMNFVSGVVFDRWSEAWFDCSQCSIRAVTICDCFSSGRGRTLRLTSSLPVQVVLNDICCGAVRDTRRLFPLERRIPYLFMVFGIDEPGDAFCVP